MKTVQMFCVILIISLWAIESDAGSGISGGTMAFTMQLGDQRSCQNESDCVEICNNQAKNPSSIVRVKCIKFVGNIQKHCCCYSKSTTACCQMANSGLDCIPS